MQIHHTDDGKDGRFFILENGEEIAFMTYVHAGPGKFIIEHTIVSDEHGGKGLGKQLVAAAVAFARDKHYKIVPACHFAKTVFEKAPEQYADVVF